LRSEDRGRVVPQGGTALVLSAGGVFGAYQAGVWKALAGEFHPDLVIGASIGGINGWLIASGCPPEALIGLWLDAAHIFRLRPKIPRSWHHGCLDSRSLVSRLGGLLSAYKPETQFAVVTTQLRGLRPRCFVGSEVGLPHLLASCAVPLAFDLERIDGSWYADGGLMGALPLWAAVELGAAHIVAVQAMPPAPRPVRAAMEGLRRRSGHSAPAKVEADILMIEPEAPLGGVLELLRYRPDRIRRWIEQGERDALRIKHSILKCLERQ
jgi:predicted acylesterase/phospholipase RssA